MSKKDYEAIANVLALTAEKSPAGFSSSEWSDVISIFAQRLADCFAQDNPRFDRARFLRACEVLS
jgi:hypothetical protein